MPPPPYTNAYQAQETALNLATIKVASDSMTEAAAEIHQASNDGNSIETGVSADGTWQKRCYSSLRGVSTIISMDIGKVLAAEIFTQFC